MLKRFWGETVKQEDEQFLLSVPEDLREKLNRELILESDIRKVIEHCEATGRKILDPDTEWFTGHLQVGNMTYWVVYVPCDGGYELKNAYAHRMSIEEDQ